MHKLLVQEMIIHPSLKALLNNEILAVRVPAFLSAAEVTDVRSKIEDIGIEYYVGDTKAGVLEKKGKIGPNLFRFKDNIEEYFDRVRSFDAEAKSILFSDINVPARFAAALNGALSDGTRLHRAESSKFNQKLSECTVRALSAAPPHTDWIKEEMKGFDAVEALADQFAWNVYISVGTSGGEMIVFDTTNKESVHDAVSPPGLKVQPQAGDLILFRSRNVHAVLPTQGERLTVSGFWGPRVDGGYQYWV